MIFSSYSNPQKWNAVNMTSQSIYGARGVAVKDVHKTIHEDVRKTLADLKTPSRRWDLVLETPGPLSSY